MLGATTEARLAVPYEDGDGDTAGRRQGVVLLVVHALFVLGTFRLVSETRKKFEISHLAGRNVEDRDDGEKFRNYF